jgi:hypothetical protein
MQALLDTLADALPLEQVQSQVTLEELVRRDAVDILFLEQID